MIFKTATDKAHLRRSSLNCVNVTAVFALKNVYGRHKQDQDARDEGNDRRNVCGRKGYDDLLGGGIISAEHVP